MRELKLNCGIGNFRKSSRTPPGVRELKQGIHARNAARRAGRTPPGVRELKRLSNRYNRWSFKVAPLPGCVN